MKEVGARIVLLGDIKNYLRIEIYKLFHSFGQKWQLSYRVGYPVNVTIIVPCIFTSFVNALWFTYGYVVNVKVENI
jgi:hypothetical protein